MVKSGLGLTYPLLRNLHGNARERAVGDVRVPEGMQTDAPDARPLDHLAKVSLTDGPMTRSSPCDVVSEP